MTREEILALSPGHELNLLVGKYVMGLSGVELMYEFLDRYSSDMSDAWKVVEKMNDCLHLKQHGSEGEWEALFCGISNSTGSGQTAPESISKAALLAVMNL